MLPLTPLGFWMLPPAVRTTWCYATPGFHPGTRWMLRFIGWDGSSIDPARSQWAAAPGPRWPFLSTWAPKGSMGPTLPQPAAFWGFASSQGGGTKFVCTWLTLVAQWLGIANIQVSHHRWQMRNGVVNIAFTGVAWLFSLPALPTPVLRLPNRCGPLRRCQQGWSGSYPTFVWWRTFGRNMGWCGGKRAEAMQAALQTMT